MFRALQGDPFEAPTATLTGAAKRAHPCVCRLRRNVLSCLTTEMEAWQTHTRCRFLDNFPSLRMISRSRSPLIFEF